MGILELLPAELITLITWVVIWLAACIVILIISVGLGRLLGDFLETIIGWVR